LVYGSGNIYLYAMAIYASHRSPDQEYQFIGNPIDERKT
jgi:hypothetical protein